MILCELCTHACSTQLRLNVSFQYCWLCLCFSIEGGQFSASCSSVLACQHSRDNPTSSCTAEWTGEGDCGGQCWKCLSTPPCPWPESILGAESVHLFPSSPSSRDQASRLSLLLKLSLKLSSFYNHLSQSFLTEFSRGNQCQGSQQ